MVNPVISPSLVKNVLEAKPVAGRNVKIIDFTNQDGVRICATAKTIDYAADPVDITQDCDGDYEKLASFTKPKRITMTVDGFVSKDDPIVTEGMRSILLRNIMIEAPNVFTVRGDFMITNISLSAGLKDALRFTANLRSSGKFSYVNELGV